MANWIILLTFKQSAQAHLIKTKLESEGIQVFLKHEHIAQLAPHHMEPGGPIKLQVPEDEAQRALDILKASGYVKEEKRGFRQSALIKSVDMFTSHIPGIKKKPLRLRLILAVAALLVVLTLIVSILTLPSAP